MPESLRPYIVRQGDHLLALAGRHGFEPVPVWDNPKNEVLKKARAKDGHMLLPGDVLYIPDVKPKWLAVTAGSTNTFIVPSNLVSVSVRFLADGEALAGEPYVVEGFDIDPGSLDGEGTFQAKVPARVAALTIRLTARNEAYTVKVGNLDPPDTPSGMRARLGMLGFYGRGHQSCADQEGDLEFGLRRFQYEHDLPVTGEMDQSTVSKVAEIFGR